MNADPVAVKPKSRGCSCSTGNGLFPCTRYAVVRVGHVYYCKQRASLRGIVVPALEVA